MGEAWGLGKLGVLLLNHCPSYTGPKNGLISLPQGPFSTQLPKMGINQDRTGEEQIHGLSPLLCARKAGLKGKPALDAEIDTLSLDYGASKGKLDVFYSLWLFSCPEVDGAGI